MYGPFTALPSPAARGVCRVVPSPDTLACDSGTATTVTEDYGPSLARGRIEDLFCGKAFSIQKDVLQEGSQGAKAELDRDMFTRLYHVAGLRVPAAESGILVSTLRRHLLNWPRIKNVVRVPGDSVSSDDSREVVKSSAEDGVAFWRKAVSVRVVEDKVEEPVLGTRLLLLDEKYANKQASELPPALQVVLHVHSVIGWRRCFIAGRALCLCAEGRQIGGYMYLYSDSFVAAILTKTVHSACRS